MRVFDDHFATVVPLPVVIGAEPPGSDRKNPRRHTGERSYENAPTVVLSRRWGDGPETPFGPSAQVLRKTDARCAESAHLGVIPKDMCPANMHRRLVRFKR